MPPPFTVRSGTALERDLGSWDTTGSITIPGSLTVAGAVTGSNLPASVVGSVTAADSTITVGGTATAPTVGVNAIAESKVTNLVSDLALKAPLASPTFTGTVTTAAATASGLVTAGKASGTGLAVTSDATVGGALTVTGALAGTLNATAQAFSAQTDSGTVTSSTYVTARTGTANVAGVTFTAPPSGSVRIDWSSGMSVSAAGLAIASVQVLTGAVIGSGSNVLAASDNNALQMGNATVEIKLSDFYLVTGLTPGSSYNTQLMYRVTASNTATFNRPKILVQGA